MLKATDPFLPHEKQIQASVTPFQTMGINLSENLGNLMGQLWLPTGYLHGTLMARAVGEMLPVNLRVLGVRLRGQISSVQAIF